MNEIQIVLQDELQAADSTPGITRHRAFESGRAMLVQSRVKGGTATGWHHHGNRDVYGYVVKGRARFESGPGGRDVNECSPGDFFYVPAGRIHRDVNPGDEEQVVIVCFVGSGPLVVNVDGPDEEK